jgi:cell division protein FtsQ
MIQRVRKNRRKNQVRRPAASLRAGIGLVVRTVIGTAMTAGMGLMFIVCHDLVTQCNYFRAEEIIIEGGHTLTRQEIFHASGIDEGVNIFAVNLSLVREKLELHPWIAQAEVYRDSGKKIRIRVREHQPLAVIDLGRRFVLNKGGEIFMESMGAESDVLPVITGVEYADWRPGNARDTRIFSAVMEVLAASQSGGGLFAGNAIREIRVDRDIGLTLGLEGPVSAIRIGYGDYRAKAKRAAEILSFIQTADGIPAISDLDLQSPEFVVAQIMSRESESPALAFGPEGRKGGLM